WLVQTLAKSSPRAWGCTVTVDGTPMVIYVVPTRVGVYRAFHDRFHARFGRPHARGGVPRTGRTGSCSPSSSPRAWGCTIDALIEHGSGRVVPTRVGVYR